MSSAADRASRPGGVPEAPALSQEEIALIEAQNALHQFDRVISLIDEATALGARFRFRQSTAVELNRYAVNGLMASPGAYRLGPITISESRHVPPPAEDVPRHMDEMCEYVQDHWDLSPVHLAAYVLWRLNWIHPFRDGNGRTARAASYLVLCARLGYRIPGTITIPERIAATKQMYYEALDDADAHWREERLDLTKMEQMLTAHLASQLVEIHEAATGQKMV